MENNKETNTTEERLTAIEQRIAILDIAIEGLCPPGARIIEGQLYVPLKK